MGGFLFAGVGLQVETVILLSQSHWEEFVSPSAIFRSYILAFLYLSEHLARKGARWNKGMVSETFSK